ncbi:MAG: GNAT family N-acetyltransferase [Janthinobacterium lividum]
MAIDYRNDAKLSAEDVAVLFDKSGIRRPTKDLERLQHMIDNANLIITAWDADTLVGIARALTDFVWCCYLSDLAVDQEYQHQGIGRELLRQVQQALMSEEVTLVLLSAPEAMAYYPNVGFEAVQSGWMIKRTK